VIPPVSLQWSRSASVH